MKSSIKRVFKHFLKTTTFHGFKYLCSPFYIDRAVWAACCCASACCAGMLCAVLWARFMQVPALLSLADVGAEGRAPRAPLVAVCPSPARVARLFEHALSLPAHNSVYLPNLFIQIIRNKPLALDSLQFLERVLTAHNMTLSEALSLVTPSCGQLVNKCRWREREGCGGLFEKHVTAWGVCCIAHPEVLNAKSRHTVNLNGRLDLMLNCSDDKFVNGCEFFTKYPGEEWIFPTALTTGYDYKAQITFVEVLDSNKEKLVDGDCVSDPDYSRRQCFIRCKEARCGCSDPLRLWRPAEHEQHTTTAPALPQCTLSRMNCLRGFTLIDAACQCRQACQKIRSDTVLEEGRLHHAHYTYDPFYVGLNASHHTVLSIHLSSSGTKVFELMYSETWWSLLSSLGGVFNMFLGVGLFSALELIVFVIYRLPLAVR